ncbi:hypothetical protein ACTFIW_002597 [Dictyostelium discoideum]
MNFKSIILLLSFLYFIAIVGCLKTEDLNYYQDGEKLVFQINPNSGFNGNNLVISEFPSTASKGNFNQSDQYLNMPFFNLDNGLVSYNLTLLKLSPNSLPYKAYLSPFIGDGYNYTLYFNLFEKTNYCSKANFKNSEEYTYQSCINGGKNNDSFAQAGDLFEASYDISQIDLVRINYKAIQFNYGCSRNTWFNIYCDKNNDFRVLNMSANYCDYEVNILSSHACPVYSSIPYSKIGDNTYELNVGPFYNPTALFYYINGSMIKFDLNSTSQYTPSPTPSETPSPTPSETPPTLTETPSETPTTTPVPSPNVYCRSNRYGITINSTETVSCRGFGKTKCITKLGSECSTDNLDGEIVCTSKSLHCFGTNIQCISGDVYCSIDF